MTSPHAEFVQDPATSEAAKRHGVRELIARFREGWRAGGRDLSSLLAYEGEGPVGVTPPKTSAAQSVLLHLLRVAGHPDAGGTGWIRWDESEKDCRSYSVSAGGWTSMFRMKLSEGRLFLISTDVRASVEFLADGRSCLIRAETRTESGWKASGQLQAQREASIFH